MRVVADTGPLNYLVTIESIDILPRLFERIFVPSIVRAELSHPRAPAAVRYWAVTPPDWLSVCPTPESETVALSGLDGGERAAIALALSVRADLVLMDDRGGVAAAIAQGLEAIGTLGVLDLAARRGMIDLAMAISRLKATNFRVRPELLDDFLSRWREWRGGS